MSPKEDNVKFATPPPNNNNTFSLLGKNSFKSKQNLMNEEFGESDSDE